MAREICCLLIAIFTKVSKNYYNTIKNENGSNYKMQCSINNLNIKICSIIKIVCSKYITSSQVTNNFEEKEKLCSISKAKMTDS